MYEGWVLCVVVTEGVLEVKAREIGEDLWWVLMTGKESCRW